MSIVRCRPDILILFDFLTTGRKFLKGEENEKEMITFFLTQLASYSKRFNDWRPYVLSSPLHYTRNLVEDNEELEMIVLVWLPGQLSRIHDHGGSHCFLTVLEGEVVEKKYLRIENDGTLSSEGQHPSEAPGPCPPLKEVEVSKLHVGESAYIHDRIGLHIVGNESDSVVAVTLHVYSPPIKRVKVFDPSTNELIARAPGFFSVHGRKTGKE